jgi:hypothetical protein
LPGDEEGEEIVVRGKRPEQEAEADATEVQPPLVILAAAEHTKGKRPSTLKKHQKGQARKVTDGGGEKADKKRRPQRKRPKGHSGPWPPRIWPFIFIPVWLFDPCSSANPVREFNNCGPMIV